MKVFKFGGASTKDAEGVKNVASILKQFETEDIFIVISAMGKMTNAFEKLTNCYFNDKNSIRDAFNYIKVFHYSIIELLFPDKTNLVYTHIESLFNSLLTLLKKDSTPNYNFVYDSIVPYGELLASTILSHYLNQTGQPNKFIDARQIIITDATYREARINWDKTPETVSHKWELILKEGFKFAVTQGFIGSSAHGFATTLGREGSDFTAAIIGYSLKAEEVVIWKDVPGVLNADPKEMPDCVKIDSLTYSDAIELAYYGATVIHPKTIKPLQNAGIPLLVKSFISPSDKGTYIGNVENSNQKTPSFIFKKNQILISIMPNDFSFIVEHNISTIFQLLSKYDIKVNLMQNSALSFSICSDNDPQKIPLLLKDLKTSYKIYYNTSLDLVTIRHYNEQAIERICNKKTTLLEQKSRNTVQFVIK
ncbi:MAG: aspartate kinase [Bacteroidales bacterium]|nr:aspartate kinase [Bacteroidales bacterium]